MSIGFPKILSLCLSPSLSPSVFLFLSLSVDVTRKKKRVRELSQVSLVPYLPRRNTQCINSATFPHAQKNSSKLSVHGTGAPRRANFPATLPLLSWFIYQLNELLCDHIFFEPSLQIAQCIILGESMCQLH